MLFIYIKEITHRADYIFRQIFKNSLNVSYQLTDDLAIASSNGVFLNYSEEDGGEGQIVIRPAALLFDKGIAPVEIEPFSFNGHTVFFHVQHDDGEFPYDPFALCFYMLSRYEEYLPFEPDIHGRFPADQSAAFRHHFLEEPVVDRAVEDLRKLLNAKVVGLRMEEPGFSVQLSYDIDAPYAFHGKGLLKNLGGSVKHLLESHPLKTLRRLQYAISPQNDPFDVFDDLLDQLDRAGHVANFFLLLEHEGEHNPSIDYMDASFRELVSKLKLRHQLGIHPSYDCIDAIAYQKEAGKFEAMNGHAPEMSRQHFIKLRLPETYELLISNGVSQDHSMGFPDRPGFRAGTSKSFLFYNLERERSEQLLIHPFCLMDAAFEYYLSMNAGTDIWDKFLEFQRVLSEVGGTMSVVFHNDLISNYECRNDWKAIHSKFLGLVGKV